MAKKKIIEKEDVKPTESVDISTYEKKVVQADSFLDSLKRLLKKHWGLLLIILIGLGIYEFTVLVKKEMDKPKEEQVIPIEEVNAEPYVIREYEETSEDGSTKIIQVWSDSLETVKGQ